MNFKLKNHITFTEALQTGRFIYLTHKKEHLAYNNSIMDSGHKVKNQES